MFNFREDPQLCWGIFIADKFGKFVTCKLKCLKFTQQKAKKLAQKNLRNKKQKNIDFYTTP